MTPQNTKSWFANLAKYSEELMEGKISVDKALAYSAMTSKAINFLNYELKRAEFIKTSPSHEKILREIESKAFDNTIN